MCRTEGVCETKMAAIGMLVTKCHESKTATFVIYMVVSCAIVFRNYSFVVLHRIYSKIPNASFPIPTFASFFLQYSCFELFGNSNSRYSKAKSYSSAGHYSIWIQNSKIRTALINIKLTFYLYIWKLLVQQIFWILIKETKSEKHQTNCRIPDKSEDPKNARFRQSR